MKRQADNEREHIAQAVLYLEAIMFFILTGMMMLTHTSTAAFTMFTDTLSLIRLVLFVLDFNFLRV